MSQIVLGIGTSHSPMLAIDAEMWLERAEDDKKRPKLTLSDGRELSYAELAAESGNRHAAAAGIEHLRTQAAQAQAALDRLADELATAQPDIVVVIGDDQDELFHLEHMPALAIYYGQDIVMQPRALTLPNMPGWHRQALVGYSQDKANVHVGAPDYALALIDGLLEHGVDVGASSGVKNPAEAGFGHAFGFVHHRLLRNRPVPVVPVMLNTYFRPNVMRPWRCYDVGQMLRQVIEAIPGNQRIAVVASGGLSHFVTDEVLDRRVLEALRTGAAEPLRSLPVEAMRSGSSEILNWVMAGGVLAQIPNRWLEYIPVYRTPAGTGVGLGFTLWRP